MVLGAGAADEGCLERRAHGVGQTLDDVGDAIRGTGSERGVGRKVGDVDCLLSGARSTTQGGDDEGDVETHISS